MKNFIFTLIVFALALPGKATTLSDKAEISVLTCSPGKELYSLFGHTAIRIHDPEQDLDVVFNYGTFDFDTPHFYLKFAQGLLPYQLSTSHFQSFMYSYMMEERSVYSQRLQLDSLQRQKLFDLLLENYKPENRSYLYNFLYDNCTTRVRDILVDCSPAAIDWNTPDLDKNFWNLLDEYLGASPWVHWGIHTILGQRGNRTATPFQYMFLPDYLMYGLNTATVQGEHLAEKAALLYEAPDREAETPWYFSPLFVFGAGVVLLIVLMWKTQSMGLLNGIAFAAFLFSGIVGCLLVFLGGFTEHPITAPNWNILWANPLNLFVMPFLLRRQLPRFAAIYLRVYMLILFVALPVWVICQPAVPMPSVFLILLLLYLCLRLRAKKLGITA